MRIAELHITEAARRRLASRGISHDEVGQLLANRPYLTPHAHPRVPSGRLLIGPTDGARLITIVVQPDRADRSLWHVMAGWRSTRREILIFRRHA